MHATPAALFDEVVCTQERVAQCEKAKSELLLQQALMQQSAGLAGPSSLLTNTRLFQPALGPGIVQGVAVGLPMKVTMKPCCRSRGHAGHC